MPSDHSSLSTITVWLNGASVSVLAGSMASAVVLAAELPFRFSVSNEPRTALCGMGICFECRATVDGIPHRRTCQLTCREGMRLETESNTQLNTQPDTQLDTQP